jgi:hypothetical protein
MMAYTEPKQLEREKEIIDALRKMNLPGIGHYLTEKVTEDRNVNDVTRNISDEVVFYDRKAILHQIEYLALILTKK